MKYWYLNKLKLFHDEQYVFFVIKCIELIAAI